MENKFSPETAEAFDAFVRYFNTAVKNIRLYSPSHSEFISSIKNLRSAIGQCSPEKEELEVGITDNNVLLNGSCAREDDKSYEELAAYLHRRGFLAITILKGIGEEELASFVVSIKGDHAEEREAPGAPAAGSSALPHLKIAMLDYTSLMASAAGGEGKQEEDIWNSLLDATRDDREGAVPFSRTEFLDEFLKDSAKSARVLNRIFKSAVARADGEAASNDMRDTLSKIMGYFDRDPSRDPVSVRKDLAGMITHLDRDLMVKILSGGETGGGLAEEITRDFSDDMLGDFISSMIGEEGSVNENLIKLFDRMVAGKPGTGNIASLVADKVIGKNMDRGTLLKLQESIKELTSSRSETSFMSQVYKLTVGALADGGQSGYLSGAGPLAGLVEDLRKMLKGEGVKHERVRLLVNVLALENDAAEFEKFSLYLTKDIGDIVKAGDAGSLKDILEFFTEKLRPEQISNAEIKNHADKVKEAIYGDAAVDKLISLIPALGAAGAKNIAYIFSIAPLRQRERLIDAFTREGDIPARDAYLRVFYSLGNALSGLIAERVKGEDLQNIRDMMAVLRKTDPGSCRAVIKELVKNKGPEIYAELLKNYVPSTDEETDILFGRLEKERNERAREMLARSLAAAGSRDIIDRLFGSFMNKRGAARELLILVKLCGETKIADAAPHLGKVLNRRAFFNTRETDKLRTAAAVSLGQIGTPVSMDLVGTGLKSGRSAVRKMCEIVTKLKESGDGQ